MAVILTIAITVADNSNCFSQTSNDLSNVSSLQEAQNFLQYIFISTDHYVYLPKPKITKQLLGLFSGSHNCVWEIARCLSLCSCYGSSIAAAQFLVETAERTVAAAMTVAAFAKIYKNNTVTLTDKRNACGRHYWSNGKPIFVEVNVSK